MAANITPVPVPHIPSLNRYIAPLVNPLPLPATPSGKAQGHMYLHALSNTFIESPPNLADQVALNVALGFVNDMSPLGATAIAQLQVVVGPAIQQAVQQAIQQAVPLAVQQAMVPFQGHMHCLTSLFKNSIHANHDYGGYALVLNVNLDPLPPICQNNPLTSDESVFRLSHVALLAWIHYYGIDPNPALNVAEQREAYTWALKMEIGV